MNGNQVRINIDKSEELVLLFTDDSLSGYSGKKIIALLQNLALGLDPEKEIYLEIGVFQGLSLVSVSKVFKGETIGIDNFSQFDKKGENRSIVNERFKKFNITNAQLINDDFEGALKNFEKQLGNKKIGLLFVDAAHDYRTQLMCLLLAKNYLSENAVIVVDDSNYRHVRQANQDFINIFFEFKLILEKYTPAHPSNMSEIELLKAKDTWWNGINVLLNDNENNFPKKIITNDECKFLFLNQQYIDSAKYADCAYESVKVANAIYPLKPLKLISRLLNLRKRVKRSDKKYNGRFKYLNTYTENINF